MTSSTPVTISSANPADRVEIDQEKLAETLEYIRPAVQADGGDLILLGTEGGTVNIQMVGACGGCPLSMMTLKAGIERILIDRVPGVEEVNASADAPTLDEDVASPMSSGITLPGHLMSSPDQI
ncbi:MAG TPA: NifU family protein [Acidimicrobiia bacterium]|nr:NifU family protein [Acidimicrobiia bacterium]